MLLCLVVAGSGVGVRDSLVSSGVLDLDLVGVVGVSVRAQSAGDLTGWSSFFVLSRSRFWL